MSHYPTADREEVELIGMCLECGLETAIEAIESIPSDAFDVDDARDVFQVIERLATQGKEVSSWAVSRAWNDVHGQKPKPMEMLTASGAPPGAMPLLVDDITNAWRKRSLIQCCESVIAQAGRTEVKVDALLSELEKSIFSEVRGVSTFGGKECATRMVADLERRFGLQGAFSGVPTGFYDLDRKLDGMQYGEQTVIGARPSMGKTAMGLGIALHAAHDLQIPTLFISLEMSIEALMRRACAARSEVSMGTIRKGSYTPENFQKFAAFSVKANKAPLWITDGVGGMNVNQVCAVVRRRARKDGVKLVMIDYLQKIKSTRKEEKRTYEVAEVSGLLRALAISTRVALVTLAQLNRDSEKDKAPRPPRMSDLGDSKQIEQDADTILLIDRKRTDPNGDSAIIIAKQRDGENGIVHLRFNGALARFENPARMSDNDLPI